ncbi:hypothetical protein BWQ96_07616 [Gracilariopsis chorda]|uniref:Nuclear pore complex protein NUP96 C-terminal domain-containing protein n=1 Tax=Gracilariopsis chorda TaxID=448386 RepID=A0A2V3IKT8_9FLOR|nr:hypothetical protein BWQ96_07616 [Gracilariopsis chorda]|eukprot:PXF42673.1 hypothetical protein BWQ96_07616 [Gracilariopsis chorda]
MPLHVVSPHGHLAIFASPTARRADVPLISWGPSSIYVPSNCSLNGPAQVWFHLPHVSITSAKRWCSRANARFLSQWGNQSNLHGFGFSVRSFSRYRYVDSEEDSDTEPHEDEERIESADRRRALTRKAGRTPARRRVTVSQRQEVKQEQPQQRLSPPQRPRMSARIIVDLTDDEEELKSEGELTEKPTPQPVDDPFNDPFKQPTQWQDSDLDYPKIHTLREVLFEPKPLPHQRPPPDTSPEDADMFEPHSFYAPVKTPVEPDSDVEEPPLVVTDMLAPTSPAFPKLQNSLTSACQDLFVDTGLSLGRSTRVSFNSEVLVAQKYCFRPHALEQDCFTIEATSLFSTSPPEMEVLTQTLRSQFAAWYGCQSDGTDLKTPSLRDAFNIPSVFNATAKQIVADLRDSHKRLGDLNASHASVVFGLLYALYKKSRVEYDDGEDNLLRRISQWAAGPVRTAFDDVNGEVPRMRQAVIDLCLGDVEKAADAAIECGRLRLAMLMARALETPKDDLRDDALEQLIIYRLLDPHDAQNLDADEYPTAMDDLLEHCSEDSAVDIEERLILVLLSGHVSTVARYLGFSWYRLFIMELLHGAGNKDDTQPERVASAVSVIRKSGIATVAPHGNSESEHDVAYHLLRLYEDPGGKYPIASGVYSPCSFGFNYKPLDTQFAWLLHQVLSAIIPEATTTAAPYILADGFSSQLRAAGLPLWSFYVLCTAGVPLSVLKNALVRDWPDMANDVVEAVMGRAPEEAMDVDGGNSAVRRLMNRDEESSEDGLLATVSRDDLDAENFLQGVLRVPAVWIAEARAVAARAAGDVFEECKMWLACETEEGSANAHNLLTEQIMPEVIIGEDSTHYGPCTDMLRTLGKRKHISNWRSGGGLVLDYMEQVVGASQEKPKANLVVLHDMVNRVGAYKERAKTDLQRHSATVIADGIATAQRAILLYVDGEMKGRYLTELIEDLERLPVSTTVRARLVSEYTIEEEKGRKVSMRFSGAFPGYGKYLTVEE